MDKKKICLVTGANRGIGKATALELAKMKATVVMVCRNQKLGEAARDEIIAESGNPNVDLLVADLSSMESVRQLVDEFKNRYASLHVLIHNAGVVKKEYTLTADGFETTFAVNHLAPFLLTHLLLDTLKTSAPSRIITVSSMVHKWGRINFKDLMGTNSYDMDRAYNQSKLANILFTHELARRLEGTGVTANSLEPGMTVTDFGREYTGFKAFMSRLWRVFMKSPEQGAETSVYLASAPELEDVSGKHFVDNHPVESSKASMDLDTARRLWDVSLDLTGLKIFTDIWS